MSYIGNAPISAAFLTDTFSGTGSATAFTMTVAPANTSSIIVAITGVLQDPSTYSVSGTTLTFSAAPPSGTSNISVRYLGIPASGVTTTAYRTVTNTTATAGQTSFSIPSYTVGYVDVYRNGVYLPTSDYTATTGTTVVLTNAATSGDTITTISFYVSSVLNAIPATAGAVNSTYLASSLTLTTPTLTTPTMSGAVVSSMGSSVITSGTVQATTSGTSIDFTGIPSWAKRITVILNNVVISATSNILIQLGTASGVETTGYSAVSSVAASGNPNTVFSGTTGVQVYTGSSAYITYSATVFTNYANGVNTWVASGTYGNNTSVAYAGFNSGIKTLGGVLTRVRITTVTGTDTFTAGSVNILYE